MSEGQANWWTGAIQTATSVWQAFVVPGALAAWVVYKFRVGRTDTARTTEADRSAAYMDRLEKRVAAQDADRVAADRVALHWENQARWWCQRCHDDRHDLYRAMQRGPLPDGWRLPDLPGLEEPK